MNENLKIEANLGLIQFIILLLGIIFFSSMAIFIYDSEWIIKKESDIIAMWVFVLVFCGFALWSLFVLLNSKKVILTNDLLTIYYPLIFRKKEINFTDIHKVKEDNYRIYRPRLPVFGHRIFASPIIMYVGKQTTIELYESKKIVITSFEITNYDDLARNLKNITSTYFKLKIEDKLSKKNNLGFPLFIIIIFALFMSIFKGIKNILYGKQK